MCSFLKISGKFPSKKIKLFHEFLKSENFFKKKNLKIFDFWKLKKISKILFNNFCKKNIKKILPSSKAFNRPFSGFKIFFNKSIKVPFKTDAPSRIHWTEP